MGRRAPPSRCALLTILPSKPSVVETNVSQSAGSKASLAEVGLMAPSHERGFQKSSRAWRCRPALRGCSSTRPCVGRS